MNLTYYYFLATVSNATSPAVRVMTTAGKPSAAFASAAILLSNGGFNVTQMSALTEGQYNAHNNAPFAYEVNVQL